MSTVKCTQCSETVYPLERMVFAEKVFHKGCAKCSHCQGTLTISSFASANGKLFCKPHYLELFKSSGGKYAFAGPREESSTVAGGEVIAESTKVPVMSAKKEKKESSPKKLGKLSGFLSGSASPEKSDKSAKKDGVRWGKSIFGALSKQDKTSTDDSTNEEKSSEMEAPVEVAKPAITMETKPQAQPQVQQTASKPANKLAAFLSSAPAAEVIEAPVVAAAVAAPEPVAVKPQQQAQAPASGFSKLSMFLQQVEAPAAPAPVASKPVQKKETAVEVPQVKHVSVSELIKKTEVKAPETAPVEALVVQKVQARAKSPAKATLEMDVSASISLKEKLAQARKSNGTGDQNELVEHLKAEVASYKTKCETQEAEIEVLKARVDLSDAGKEALVVEITRLNAALDAATNMKKPIANGDKATKASGQSPAAAETNENMVENSLKHAKKLLSQGKITKAQYEAAARACVEASRVVGGN